MNMESSSMQFLYPKSRQFPFDAVCEHIVRALQARTFKVSGFVIDIRDYGSGAQKLRHVSSIKNDALDVVIEFGRPQGTLSGGQWNDVAAVHEVRLARQSLRVYEDESGPTYSVYVGNAWEQDRSTWWSRPNARLNKEPRLCVKYSGIRSHHGARATGLVCDGDYREHAPEGDDPQTFITHEVMEEFRIFLHEVVLPAIEALPVADAIEAYVAPPPIPMPVGEAGSFFAYGEYRDVRRIELGKKCLDELPLAERYGMAGNGWRLAPLGIKGGVDLPKVAFDGFLWCGTTPTVPGERSSSFADQLIKVTPKDACGIYVADNAAYGKRRAELAKASTRGHFTQEEIDDAIRARACTIVPITDYAGTYEEPVYLINRELGFDEVEVIGKRAA